MSKKEEKVCSYMVLQLLHNSNNELNICHIYTVKLTTNQFCPVSDIIQTVTTVFIFLTTPLKIDFFFLVYILDLIYISTLLDFCIHKLKHTHSSKWF